MAPARATFSEALRRYRAVEYAAPRQLRGVAMQRAICRRAPDRPRDVGRADLAPPAQVSQSLARQPRVAVPRRARR
eukprot:scaffold133474_cov95-Phaeocystis_antarctica.AAC.1